MKQKKTHFCRIKRGFMSMLLSVMLLGLAVPSTVYADTGPKPSVVVDFVGAPEGTYYATLLSEKKSTGPASAWDGTVEDARKKEGDEEYEIWKAFVEYKDSDGFYFLQRFWECTDADRFTWGYYPPPTFKVLVYYPESDTFFVTGIHERYAFDSYFTVDLSTGTSVAEGTPAADYEGADWPEPEPFTPAPIERTENLVQAEKSYDYTLELLSLAARIVLTIAVEVALAWLLGFREKRVLGYIAVVNIVTQIVLNVLLNMANYNSGQQVFVVKYVLYELVVTAIELAAYLWGVGGVGEIAYTKKKITGYTVLSNVLSFVVGMWLARVIPGIF